MGKERVKLPLPDMKTYCNPSMIKAVGNWCANWKTGWLKIGASQSQSRAHVELTVCDEGGPSGPWDKGGLHHERCWGNWAAIWER